ncbi:protein PfhB2 [Actinobacillus equuli]|nr:protein PfhB2 [Actinobacillus equuli]
MSAVFGAGWDSNGAYTFSGNSEHFKNLKGRWEKFRKDSIQVNFYPNAKAKVFADKIIGGSEHDTSSFQNGAYSEKGDASKPTNEFRVGKHSILVPDPIFESYTNKIQENSNSLDLSTLAELLSQPYLFIDKSKYRENDKKDEPKDFSLKDKDDQKLLEETEQEKQKENLNVKNKSNKRD